MKKEADTSQVELVKQDSAGKTPPEPFSEPKKKAVNVELKRRLSLRRKGSASASQNLVAFMKSGKKEQDPQKRAWSNQLLRKIMGQQCCTLLLVIPLSFLGTVQDLGTSHFIGKSIDAMKDGNYEEFETIIYQWMVIIAIGSVFGGVRDWLYGMSSEKIGLDIRERFFGSIIKKDIGFFDDRKVGDILSRLTSDTQIVQMGLTVNISMFLKSAFTIIGVFIIMFTYSWKNTLIAIGFLFPMFIIMPLWARLTQFTQVQYQDVKAEASSIANESIGNIKTVKAFSGEEISVGMFEVSNNGVYNIGVNMAKYYASMMFLFQLVFNGGYIGIAYFCAESVREGELTSGQIASYLLYNWQILFNIMNVNSNLQGVSKVQGAFYEISCLVMEPAKQAGYYEKKEVTAAQTNAEQGVIEIKDIAFSYPTKPDVEVLKRINIDIKNCQTVALVGHSGCGKSSIIALIERFYDAQGGKVLFNGDDIQEIDNSWYHQQKLAIVQQEPCLFSCSIRDNVLYGFDSTNLSAEEVEERLNVALQQASCGFLEDKKLFPDGLNTKVGERGSRLSGGQKQRIAIARALVRRPRILLLDEATSALDADSEHQVQQALSALLEQQQQTVVVIAHRLSTIVSADKIICMRKGDIIEQGTHDELIALDGSYKKLVSRQLMTAALGEQVKK